MYSPEKIHRFTTDEATICESANYFLTLFLLLLKTFHMLKYTSHMLPCKKT